MASLASGESLALGLASGFVGAGVWVDVPQSLLTTVPSTPARFGGDGKLHVSGMGKAWGYLARMPVPDSIAKPGRIMLRAVIEMRHGGAGLCLVDVAQKTALHQVFVRGPGVHVLELDATLAEAPGQLIIRNDGVDNALVDFDLLLLQCAVRAPEPLVGIKDAPESIVIANEDQHPAIRAVTSWRGDVPTGFFVNWVGSLTAQHFNERLAPMKSGFVAPPPPAASEEYFEWTDMLEAIDAAADRFTMVELGAGYGRWVVDAWNAMRRKGLADKPLHLVAVEAEPQHFRWLEEHFRNNDLDPAKHRLIEAAVAGQAGTVSFFSGHSGAWYGQAIVSGKAMQKEQYPQAEMIEVPALTLDQILDGIDHVDLLDMDVQGAELDVCSASMATLIAKVRRVHIGTHATAIDIGLRRLFRAAGWRNIHDYPYKQASTTPYGVIQFGDGVQSWLNPRLA